MNLKSLYKFAISMLVPLSFWSMVVYGYSNKNPYTSEVGESSDCYLIQ